MVAKNPKAPVGNAEKSNRNVVPFVGGQMAPVGEESKKWDFSNTKIEKLPPSGQEKPTYYYDAKTEGLALTVTRTGVKTFIFKRWVNGGTTIKKLGRFDSDGIGPGIGTENFEKHPLIVLGKNPSLNVDQARALVRVINGGFATRINPFSKPVELMEEKELTVNEMFELYMERHIVAKRKQPDQARRAYNHDCRNRFGDAPLSEISIDVAHDWYRTLSKRSMWVANRRLQLMRAMFNKGKTWKKFSGDNPFASVELKAEAPRQFALTDAQARKIWDALEQDGNEWIRDFAQLLLLTGARKTELLTVEWDEIDFDEWVWHIPTEKTKTTARNVALNPLEIEILKKRKASSKSRYVFPGRYNMDKHLINPDKQWRRIREKAGIPECTMHDLRTSLSSALANSTNPKLAQVALGHADIKTTMKHYVVVGMDAQRAAKQSVADRWTAKVES